MRSDFVVPREDQPSSSVLHRLQSVHAEGAQRHRQGQNCNNNSSNFFPARVSMAFNVSRVTQPKFRPDLWRETA